MSFRPTGEVVDVEVFHAMNPPPDVLSFPEGVSLTKQEFADEADVNNILAKYLETGVLDPNAISARQAVFGDFSEVGDFQECQLRVLAARDAFGSLPAETRDRFQNDPGRLLDFLADGANRPEAVKLGLLKAETEPPPSSGAGGGGVTPPVIPTVG